MAWLRVGRSCWQSCALRLSEKTTDGFTHSRLISWMRDYEMSSSFVDSMAKNRFSLRDYEMSSSFVDSIAKNRFSLRPHPLSFRSLNRAGTQEILSNNSTRWMTTASHYCFAPVDSSTIATGDERVRGIDSTSEEKTESTTLKEKNSGFHDGVRCLSGLEATKPEQKPRIVVLGTGWAGCRVMKTLDTDIYDVVCISPRNHMVFTPLLASTCVGTLEFRSVTEPVSLIQPALSKSPNSYFLLGLCRDIDPDNHEVYCETIGENNGSGKQCQWKFKVAYDKLVVASGAEALTFGIHGVKENAIFLRDVHHAREIRRKLLLNLMLSDVPGISEEMKKQLLHCVVVGGGPTGVEFSGELSDFIRRDVHERYSHVQDYIHVTLIEANEILSSFDVRLREYATKHLTKSGVRLVRGVVKDVQPQKIVLSDGTEVPYGLLVWSTGVGPSPFISSLNLPKSRGGRIGVDDWLRVPSAEDVYAVGDCSGFLESTKRTPLPALAQVAERQGKYLAGLLNRIGKAGGGRAGSAKDIALGDPFVYKHIGSMASVGRYKALVDLRESKEAKGLSLAGFPSWLMWRSAYLTRVISWRNRFYVAVNWATTFVFGRDISRI